MGLSAEVRAALLKPFAPDEIKTKAGQAGMKLAYIDARDVQQRLDEVLGEDGWDFMVEVITDTPTHATVKGSLRIGGMIREDTGQAIIRNLPEKGPYPELVKEATSDALKRAAVHFGVGRHLYEMGEVRGAVTEQQVAQSARKAGYDGPAPAGNGNGHSEPAPAKYPQPPEGATKLCPRCKKNALTDGQIKLSITKFGSAACPACQRDLAQSSAA